MYCDIMAFAMSEYLRVTFGVNLRAELSSFCTLSAYRLYSVALGKKNLRS